MKSEVSILSIYNSLKGTYLDCMNFDHMLKWKDQRIKE